MQTQEIILHVGQGFSLALGNPKGSPYKIFNAFLLVHFRLLVAATPPHPSLSPPGRGKE